MSVALTLLFGVLAVYIHRNIFVLHYVMKYMFFMLCYDITQKLFKHKCKIRRKISVIVSELLLTTDMY